MARTLIAVPCLDSVPVTFVSGLCKLLARARGGVGLAFEVQALVYESRNRLAARAVAEGYDRVLWLDSDIAFGPDLLERLSADMDEGREFVSGVYFRRRLPTRPVILKGLDWYTDDQGWATADAEVYEDYPRGEVFPIAGCGFGAVMMSTKLLTRVIDRFHVPVFTPLPMLSEDYAFCWRLSQIGVEMFADSRIELGHCGLHVYTEADWVGEREVGIRN